MAIELEVKLRVDDLATVQARLAAAGMQRVGRVCEQNHLFDSPDKSLQGNQSALRVRCVEVLDGEPVAATMTYKGPPQDSVFKQREEIEMAVSDPVQAMAILKACGLVCTLAFEKRRETWLSPPCRIELDEVARLGVFVEIEGPTEEVIATVRTKLGLDDCPSERRGYADLLAVDGAELDGRLIRL